MPGQAVETHQKITALARQKNLCSGYPKSDEVWLEFAWKSSGSVKISPDSSLTVLYL